MELNFFFLFLISSVFKKERDKSKFTWLVLLFKLFFMKIQHGVSE